MGGTQQGKGGRHRAPNARRKATRPEGAEKSKARRKRNKRPIWTRAAAVVAIGGLCLLAADRIVNYALANVELPSEVALPSSSQVYDRNGRLITTFRGEVTRFNVTLDALPEHVTQAVIAAEDRDFYQHEGLSLGGLARAAWKNVTSGEVEQGGSTITQQYVKNAILKDTSRTYERKFKEALLAIKLEQRYSKDEILERYMNTVYFGRGAYGIEAAAREYFATHARKLTLSQAAYLAGLIPAPERYQPQDGDASVAIARRDQVLHAMADEGYITSDEVDRATGRKLRFDSSADMSTKIQSAAYFLEWLRKDFLYPRFGECLYTCGLKIYTTLDLNMQRAAEDAVMNSLDDRKDPQAALVSMTPSGEVRAFVGGRDYTDVRKARGFNFASDGVRQAGSSFKPFTLLEAIDQDISTSSYISGESPKTIDDPACAGPEGIWEPENYGGASYGAMDLNSATANSVNTVYAELISEIGPDSVADLLEDFGFTAPGGGEIPPVCSLSLGSLDVSVLQMARAYAGIAGRGVLPRVSPIRYVENENGDCLLGFDTPRKMRCEKVVDTSGTRVIEANSVDVLTQALEEVITSGTAISANIGRPAAGKTGTTQDNRDAWFAGYVPQLATVVWMGYPIESGPDKKPGTGDDFNPLMQSCYDPVLCRPVDGIDVTGGSFPAAIWQSFMSVVLSDTEIADFFTPVDLPDIVLNPPPPPDPAESKDKEPGDREEESDEDHDNGRGND
jgi:penicillin-binding protein 1A